MNKNLGKERYFEEKKTKFVTEVLRVDVREFQYDLKASFLLANDPFERNAIT